VKKYAQTPQGVQWHSCYSQEVRFEQIFRMLPCNLTHLSLVDAGCGFGDFYTYLQTRNTLPKKYIGIDSLDFMCSIATRNTQETILHTDILHNHALPYADYYICSGALNTLTKFESYLFLHNCYQHATQGIIFNALFGEKTSGIYNYLNTQDIQQLAQKLSPATLSLEKNYLPNDITVGFFKNSV
jgi:SAM-dependent methyltransferase